MPTRFASVPDATRAPEARILRAQHRIILSGKSELILAMVPELVPLASTLEGAQSLPYVDLVWLFAPAIVAPLHALPEQSHYHRWAIDAACIGRAFECLVGKYGLDVTPCSASVARARLMRVSSAARSGPAHEAQADLMLHEAEGDWYETQQGLPHDGDGNPVALTDPAADPPCSLLLKIEDLIDEGGTLATFGLLEAVCGGRMLLGDRVAASSFSILFGMLGEKSFPGLGAVAGTLRETPAMGPELGRLAKGALPDPMVARISSGTPAIVEIADRLARAAAASTGPARSASGPDLVTALGHLPTHAAIMCVGTPVTAVEAYRYVAQLDRALGHDGSALTLPRLIVNDGELEFLLPRLVSDEIESDTDTRIAFVMTVLRETREELATTARTTSGDASGQPLGYSKMYEVELRKKKNDPSFVGACTMLEARLQAGGPKNDPLQIIRSIFGGDETVFVHALLGKKKKVAGMPVVELIFSKLHVAQGGAYAGAVAYASFLPPPVVGVPKPHPPTMLKLWTEHGLNQNFDYDYVNGLLFAVVARATGTEPSEVCPQAEVFGRVTDLQALIVPLETYLDGYGFTDHEHGVAKLFSKAIAYLTFNNQHQVAMHRHRVAECIHTVLREASGARQAVLVQGEDPCGQIVRRLIAEASPGFAQLEAYHSEAALGLHTQHMYRLYVEPSTSVVPPGGPPSRRPGKEPAKTDEKPPGLDGGPQPAEKSKKPLTVGCLHRVLITRVDSGTMKAAPKDKADAIILGSARSQNKKMMMIDAFMATPGVPKNACGPCFMSTLGEAACCDTPAERDAAKDHATSKSSAHVPNNNKSLSQWQETNLTRLLKTVVWTAAAAGANAGSASPFAARRDAAVRNFMAHPFAPASPAPAAACFDPLHPSPLAAEATCPVGELSFGVAPAAMSCSSAPSLSAELPTCACSPAEPGVDASLSTSSSSAAAAPVFGAEAAEHSARRSCFAAPVLGPDANLSNAVVFVPVIAGGQGPPLIGVPRNAPDFSIFGQHATREGRDVATHTTERWIAGLFPNRSDVHPIYLFTESPDTRVVGAVVHAGKSVLVDDGSESLRQAYRAALEIKWISPRQAMGEHPVAGIFAAAAARLLGFAKPVDDTVLQGRQLGAMAPQRVPPSLMQHATSATPKPWSRVVADADASMAQLRVHLTGGVVRARAEAGVLAGEVAALADFSGVDDGPELRAAAAEADAKAVDLEGWRECLKYARYDELAADLRSACYYADDSRLATIRHPAVLSRVTSSHLDPLPSPPPPGLIPAGVTTFEDGLWPWAVERILVFQKELHAYLLWMLDPQRDESRRPAVRDVFLDTTAMRPWLAHIVSKGYVVELAPGGGLRVRDASVAPKTHLGREYIGEIAARSEDFALFDGLLTHGIPFLADVPPQILLMKPLGSLEDGALSVHTELARLIELDWYEAHRAPSASRLILAQVPCRSNMQGSVDRAGADQGRRRRIVDDGAPHGTHLTLGGQQPVVSRNSRCSVKQQSVRLKCLRHTPAIRRPLEIPPSLLPPAGRVSSAHPVAPAPMPRGIAAKRVAKGMAPFEPTPPYEAWGSGTHSYPQELKAMLQEILISVCILDYAALLLGEHIFGFEDDHKDFFHQFATMVAMRWQCCFHALDPHAIAAGHMDAELVAIAEKCMSMGSSPASNWSQRFSTEHSLYFCEDFNEHERPLIEQLARDVPKFGEWFAARKAMARPGSIPQWWLMIMFVWTDDPFCICVGAERCVRAVTQWGVHLRKLGVIRSACHKRGIGIHCSHIGGRLFFPGLLAHVTEVKRNHLVDRLDAFLSGPSKSELETSKSLRTEAITSGMRIAEYIKLLGFCNHLVCLLAMPYSVMYGMYEALDAARAIHGGESFGIVPVTARAGKAARQWKARAATNLGCSALAAVFESNPPKGTLRTKLHSDAAKKGCGSPGIGGNLYEVMWAIPFVGPHAKYNEMPIVATEFIAGAVVNLLLFGPELAGAPVTLVMDALVASNIFASKAGKSQLMQYLHELVSRLPEYVALSADLLVSHEYGPSNIIADALSRGKPSVAIDVAEALGMSPLFIDAPARVFVFLDAALYFYRHGEPDPSITGAMLYGSEYSSDPMGDGPSPGRRPAPRLLQSSTAPRGSWSLASLLTCGLAIAAVPVAPIVPIFACLAGPVSAADAPPPAPAYTGGAGTSARHAAVPAECDDLNEAIDMARRCLRDGRHSPVWALLARIALALGHGPVAFPDLYDLRSALADVAKVPRNPLRRHGNMYDVWKRRLEALREYCLQLVGGYWERHYGDPRGMSFLASRQHAGVATLDGACAAAPSWDSHLACAASFAVVPWVPVAPFVACFASPVRAAESSQTPLSARGPDDTCADLESALAFARLPALGGHDASGLHRRLLGAMGAHRPRRATLNAMRAALAVASGAVAEAAYNAHLVQFDARGSTYRTWRRILDDWLAYCRAMEYVVDDVPARPERDTAKTAERASRAARTLGWRLAAGLVSAPRGLVSMFSGRAFSGCEDGDGPSSLPAWPPRGFICRQCKSRPCQCQRPDSPAFVSERHVVEMAPAGSLPQLIPYRSSPQGQVGRNGTELERPYRVVAEHGRPYRAVAPLPPPPPSPTCFCEAPLGPVTAAHCTCGSPWLNQCARCGGTVCLTCGRNSCTCDHFSPCNHLFTACAGCDGGYCSTCGYIISCSCGYATESIIEAPPGRQCAHDGPWPAGFDKLAILDSDSDSDVPSLRDPDESDDEEVLTLDQLRRPEMVRETSSPFGLLLSANVFQRFTDGEAILPADVFQRFSDGVAALVSPPASPPAPASPLDAMGYAGSTPLDSPDVLGEPAAPPLPDGVRARSHRSGPNPLDAISSPSARVSHGASSSRSESTYGSSALFNMLASDTSPLALSPARPEVFRDVIESISGYMQQAYAPSTQRKDRAYFSFWSAVCAEYGTSPYRTDALANNGTDAAGLAREQVLQCIVLIRKYVTMKPRSASSPGALPESAMQLIRGVRRVHLAAGLSFANFDMARGVLRGMMREYVRIYKVTAVAPNRKCPFPHEAGNNVLLGLLNAPQGGTHRGQTIDYASYKWFSLRACFEVLAETGNRGDEARRFTFGSLVWKIGGAEVAAPSREQLDNLTAGDGVWLKHSTSKSDPFGFLFGTIPSFLAYSSSAPRNACRRLAGLERVVLLAPAARGETALFGPVVGTPFTYDEMSDGLDAFLVAGAGVAEGSLSNYSPHSFRITLATTLAAAKCPLDTIKRMLRWRADDSVLIYARLPDAEATQWLRAAQTVHVDSRVASRLLTVPIDININVGPDDDVHAAIDADVAAAAEA